MLREIFTRLTKRCDKFQHYFPLYEKHFNKYVGKSPRILEIGVRGGGSLQMWQKYFGEGTYVHGIDIDAKCKAHEDIDNNIHVTIGDATDPVFVEREMKALNIREFDIIIDDGSHENQDQITTLKLFYSLLKSEGVYWCEDTHTSYYPNREDGGYGNPKSFTSYVKNVVDVLSHHPSHAIGHGPIDGPHVPKKFVKPFNDIQCVSFYDSVIVIDKGPRLHFKRIVKK
jgi:SAM-dependent methyltransferase